MLITVLFPHKAHNIFIAARQIEATK